MTTLTTNRSLTKALRTLCCAGALTACSAWATVVTWQLSPGGSLGATKDLSQPGYANTAQGVDNMARTDASNQTSFKSAPESGATSETGATKAAALNDKLQARDTDFQQQAPSTIANAQAPSATQPGGAFNEQFVSVPNYQFASMAPGSMGVSGTSSAGGVVPVPEMSALFPIVGLIVAVSCTRILRRRRAAQLSAARILV